MNLVKWEGHVVLENTAYPNIPAKIRSFYVEHGKSQSRIKLGIYPLYYNPLTIFKNIRNNTNHLGSGKLLLEH